MGIEETKARMRSMLVIGFTWIIVTIMKFYMFYMDFDDLDALHACDWLHNL